MQWMSLLPCSEVLRFLRHVFLRLLLVRLREKSNAGVKNIHVRIGKTAAVRSVPMHCAWCYEFAEHNKRSYNYLALCGGIITVALSCHRQNNLRVTP